MWATCELSYDTHQRHLASSLFYGGTLQPIKTIKVLDNLPVRLIQNTI